MPRRVAVSVKSMNGLDSRMDPRFGRANAFLIVQQQTETIVAEFLNNASSAVQGAGTEASREMKSNDVEAVISGRFGPKAIQSLDAFGIEMWTAPEGITAKQALKDLVDGRLERVEIKVY